MFTGGTIWILTDAHIAFVDWFAATPTIFQPRRLGCQDRKFGIKDKDEESARRLGHTHSHPPEGDTPNTQKRTSPPLERLAQLEVCLGGGRCVWGVLRNVLSGVSPFLRRV